MKFRKGDTITIEGEEYEVIYVVKEYPNIVEVKLFKKEGFALKAGI